MFLIVACSKNYVIGRLNSLPWHISEDLKKFKEITINCAVVMGRKTFESLNFKPLKNRLNIVITSEYKDFSLKFHSFPAVSFE